MTPMQLGTQAELDILGLAVTAGAAMGLIYGLFSDSGAAAKLCSGATDLRPDLHTDVRRGVFCIHAGADELSARIRAAGHDRRRGGLAFRDRQICRARAAAVFGATAKPAVRSMHKISAKSRRMFVKKYPNSEKSKKCKKALETSPRKRYNYRCRY